MFLPCRTQIRQRRKILRQRRKYVRFTAGGRIISSSYDVFANAQRIVKVKEAKSEERTVMKS
jgi:alanine dehydrogenase